MAVCFHTNIIVKTFDENRYYPLKMRKCKEFDGPNDFSILWNQLLILFHNNLIYDKNTLNEKFNNKILVFYKNNILREIKKILYKFMEYNLISIKLYYNSYTIHNNENTQKKLLILYKLIQDL